jgi:hypothetical protein
LPLAKMNMLALTLMKPSSCYFPSKTRGTPSDDGWMNRTD